MNDSLSGAQKAWSTRRSPVYRARQTARQSQVALKEWAKTNGWHVVFLDAPSGSPRIGIVDAVLLRVRSRSKDQIDVRLVQLKSGTAGLTAGEFDRLCSAVERIDVEGLAALCTGKDVFIAPVSRALITAVQKLRPKPTRQGTPRPRART